MDKISITQAQPKSQRERREVAEEKAIAAAKPDGHMRRRAGKVRQIIFRVTPEKREQLERLADALSAGRTTPASFTETMERALDALEEKMRSER
jgi:uncharacterized protein (DUF2342 family)